MVREVVVEQHQVGGLAGHVAAAGAHGDADVGLPQRRGVVDPVAGHRDDVAAVAQSTAAMRSLSAGVDPGDDRTVRRGRAAAELGVVGGQVAARHHQPRRPEQADLLGRSPRPVRGWSPVTIATRMPAVRQAARASATSGRGGSSSADQAEQLQVVSPSPSLAGAGPGAPGDGQHPQARGR